MEPALVAGGAEGPPPFSLNSFGGGGVLSITAATATPHYVVLGDTSGSLLVYDVFGNSVEADDTRHVDPIVALDSNARVDVLLSASAGGWIIATSLVGDGKLPLKKRQPILKAKAETTPNHIVIDPNFGRARAGNRIAWAEENGSVNIFVPGWVLDQRYQLKPPGSPDVRALAWSSHLLAFATDESVHVFDMRNSSAVCVITAPHARMRPADKQLEDLKSPLTPPTPPSPLSDSGPFPSRPDSSMNVDFEAIDAERAAMAAAASSASKIGNGTPRFVQGEAPPPLALTPENSSHPQFLAKWAPSVALFMENEDDVADSEGGKNTTPESATIVHVTWPLSSRSVKIGPHRTGLQYTASPRDVSVIFRLERGDLPVSLPGTLGIMGGDDNGSDWNDGGGLFGQGEIDSSSRSFADLSLSPILYMLPFGETERIILVGTAWHSLALHLVDQSGRCLRSMGLPHSSLKHGEMLSVPGGDPLVLILSHQIDEQDPDLRRVGSVGSIESGDTARLADTNVTMASTLTLAKQVKWLLDHNRFSDALEIAQRAPGGSLRREKVDVASIGDQFLDSIHSEGDFQRLAEVLPDTITSTSPEMGMRAKDKVMEARKARWERWIEKFKEANRLSLVAKNIPTYEPRFDKKVYDDVLIELAEFHPVVMAEVLKTWPADVFSLTTVTRKVESEQEKYLSVGNNADREALKESLLMLYGLSGRHDETLNLLLKDKSETVFEYVKSHHLYEAVRSKDKITGLFEINAQESTDLLVHAPETVLPPDAVVPILEEIGETEWTFRYLDVMFKTDIDRAEEYHNLLLKLYVKHGEKGTLLNFLKTSNHYDLEVALDAMGGANKKGHEHERVFVLAAMGDTNGALDILLNELDDTVGAIEFASGHGDTVLWERLIKHASGNAHTLAALLDSPAGGKVDPIRLIPLLNSEMRIPHLRDRLHRILVDAALERALREDATAALRFDADHLLEELNTAITLPPNY